MKKLLVSSTTCPQDYNADCNYIFALVDEKDVQNLLRLIDQVQALERQITPRISVYSVTTSNFLNLTVASTIDNVVGLTEHDINRLEGGNEEVVICETNDPQGAYGSIPEERDLFGTLLGLSISESGIILQAEPRHLGATVESQEITRAQLQELAQALRQKSVV
jgi:hypothetical protein